MFIDQIDWNCFISDDVTLIDFEIWVSCKRDCRIMVDKIQVDGSWELGKEEEETRHFCSVEMAI